VSAAPDVAEQDAYHELQCYTLAHSNPAFLHQHVLDAWVAQQADAETKPIGLTFALVGLYLHVECAFSGRQVQRAHMTMGQRKRTWPALTLPAERGAVRVHDVLAAAPGLVRDEAIAAWCASVWGAFRGANRAAIVALVEEYRIVVNSRE
jgi:uncharacterized protein DUF5946